MSEAGYYRQPTIHQETVVFVCEDDLWTVPAGGGVARRLTSNPGRASSPALSPDGSMLAFAGRDEGQFEVYVMPAEGGPVRRLTFLGAQTRVNGWTPDGSAIVFSSTSGQPFGTSYLYTISPEVGEPVRLETGPGSSLSFGPTGGRVIGRNTTDIARWKRYRGGLTGELWVDAQGDGSWRKLLEPGGNVALPLWVGERIYFVSDHQGIGNLYSCTPGGNDLRRHTHHSDYYVRHPSTDGHRIVYHAGADLFLFDPASGGVRRIEVEFHSPRAERNRKFVEADRYLQGYALHPKGHSVALTTRGKAFSMGNWEGAVVQHGDADGTRYRLASWLADGTRLAVVSDASGEDAVEIHPVPSANGEPAGDGGQEALPPAPLRLEGLDIGRPVDMLASPKGEALALANQRNELMLVDLASGSARVLDHSRHGTVLGMAWSPDGRWLAYGLRDSARSSVIKLCRPETGENWPVTSPVLWDYAPSFDPDGKYLYFISERVFNPVYDNLQLELGFPKGGKPFLVTLRSATRSPFTPVADEARKDANETDTVKKGDGSEDDAQRAGETPVEIDLEGIADRIVAFPVPEGRYRRVVGIKDKAVYSTYPVEGALDIEWFSFGAPPAKGKLEAYDLKERKSDTLVDGITDFGLSQDASTLIYRAGNRLRVLKAGEKPKDENGKGNGNKPGRSSGWLDLGRVKVSVLPPAEWRQMFRETWRLQRDYFWTPDMSGIDWQRVYERYLPLVDRVGTRSEFSDLLWEMQGELGTSHAYEYGGDYRPEPEYHQGFLGADLSYEPETDSYRIDRIVRGDVWDETWSSPLARAGLGVEPGDRIVAVGGRKVGLGVSPQSLLVNQADSEVLLTVAPAKGGQARTLTVRTLREDRRARYREWVEANRRRVHEATGGKVGYLHIPDMGPFGFAEFHRGFLVEADRDGLIVDVRFNGGGHVSELLLEKLARKRLGYDIRRWGEPVPYPSLAVPGPMVAVTNEFAGSDGDIFSHGFKMLGLGPLIGKRTWGGVIGINLNSRLLDGGITTQPEFSFWFNDVGFGVENYGTDPTIEVDIRPQDYVAGRDPQLERALDEISRLLEEKPVVRPDFGKRPSLAPPPLPER